MQGTILFEYVETVVWRIHYAARQNKYKIHVNTVSMSVSTMSQEHVQTIWFITFLCSYRISIGQHVTKLKIKLFRVNSYTAFLNQENTYFSSEMEIYRVSGKNVETGTDLCLADCC